MGLTVVPAPIRAWLDRWGRVTPIFVAEFIAVLGFGGLLPVLPLYYTAEGVDLATLGVVIAAWPGARLIGEPIFGWVADRYPRVPLMVAGLLLGGVFTFLPLVITGPLAFFVLRAAAGFATAIYDPAARGYLTDATPPDRRGEAFGLYGAAQMGGLMVGPAVGAIGADRLGGIGFVFVLGGVALALAAIPIALMARDPGTRTHPAPPLDTTDFPIDTLAIRRRAATDVEADRGSDIDREADVDHAAPTRLLNRGLLAALALNAGGNFGAGTYDVIWSLFLSGLGAGLDLIGLTFALFGLPILVLSPLAGRLVDRRGALLFVVLGSLMPAVAGILYTLIRDPVLAVPLILVEATGFALLNPALYAVVAASSPSGRSSTTQGIFGAAGTIGFILASLLAGVLAARNILYPFYLFSSVLVACLLIGVVVGGRQLRGRQR